MKCKPFSEFLAVPPRNGLTKPKKVRGQGFKMVNMGELFKYSRMNNIPMDRVPLTDKEQQSSMLEAGDLLFARQSLVREGAGKCSIFLGDSESVCFESHLIRCRLDRTAHNPLFYYYYFASPQGKVSMDTIIEQGAGAAGIRGSDLTKLMLPQYPLDFQNRVASILDNVDSKIQLNHQINHTLEQMAQAIFKSWFVDFEPVKAKIAAREGWYALQPGNESASPVCYAGELADQPINFDLDTYMNHAAMQAISGKDAEQLARMQVEKPEEYAELYATAELFPSAMQDSELGEIPEGWEVNQIGDVIQRLPVGKKYSQKTVSEVGRVPVLDQGKSGIIGYHDDEPGIRACTEDPVIVFANHTCYMRVIMHDFSAIQNVLPFKGVSLNIYWLFFATVGKQSFVEYKGHWPDFVIKEIVVPNGLLADRFGNLVANLMVSQFSNELQNMSLVGTRDTLLPKLLSGELSVAVIESEVEA